MTDEAYQSKLKWDRRFMELAAHTAIWSKDPRHKVGCVIVSDDRNVLSGGYNGFPRGIDDSDDRLNDQVRKRLFVVHAEANAVAAAARNGHSLLGATAYVNRAVCSQCAALFIQAGIRRVVHVAGEPESNWAESHKLADEMLLEAGVDLTVTSLE